MRAVGEWRQGSGGGVSPARLSPVSARRKRLNRDLAAVVAAKRETVRYCQAQPLIKAALDHPDNTEADRRRYVQALQACRPWAPSRPHHVLKRSRGSAATLIDGSNLLLICDFCDDDFVEREYVLATRAGLLTPSHAVPRLLGRIVGKGAA